MTITVNSLSDLYDLFGSDHRFASLNHRIYKDTECGASISIYGTVAAEDATPEDRARAERAGMQSALWAEYHRVFPALDAAYKAEDEEEQFHIASADADFHEGKPEKFIQWARRVVPGAFPETVVSPTRVPVAYHNGHREEIPASFELTGFTIQSIVEGSDAEVNSDVFRLGTTKEEVDNWISDMEAETDRLWHEANGVPWEDEEEAEGEDDRLNLVGENEGRITRADDEE